MRWFYNPLDVAYVLRPKYEAAGPLGIVRNDSQFNLRELRTTAISITERSPVQM